MKKVAYIFIALFCLVSCEQVDSKKETNLVLNNGDKWVVDAGMNSSIKKAEELLHTFNQSQIKNYKKLASDLEEQNNILIKSCTMSGKSHDMLHHWLLPNIKLIKQLSEANNLEREEEIVKELNTSYDTFNNYFN
ncbi:hypothetical protein [Flammeovirga kamogawensis]|uniref:Lipoprotein n=1 Tax=Flammeovirga kamogawensis TaxID=373891 RepID=A0ABX8H2B8_9BACT|nr:hypothetical protein [Flammeovirga kamogawensis]MBB6463949.1 hypothetical protein [Flammeovirga kamogawensis]QWG09773.1 hypothetical protein KM029_19020 [Flammeovirga kamogawensis]TRX65283.1 hypothetical protein EO216_22430 [Flammeovirga kamogawensis]